MEHRLIGQLEVSVVGLGCNNFGGRLDQARTREVVDAALGAGVTLFDTADIYGNTLSEEYLGVALGSRRGEIVLATKFGTALDDVRKGAKPAYVRQAVTDSLRRLGTDWIDLYQLHRPDPETPIADTLGALEALVDEGIVREIGCSNFTVDQLAEAAAVAGEGFASVQNEYSLLRRAAEEGELEWCASHGLAFMPFFPLYNGMLTGKYRRGEPAPQGSRLAGANVDRQAEVFSAANFDRVEALEAFATAHEHSLVELAIAWLLARKPVVSVISGATSPAQVAANVAGGAWQLDSADLEEIDHLSA